MSNILKVALLLLLVTVAAYYVAAEEESSESPVVEAEDEENADNSSVNKALPQIDDYGETKKCPANKPFKWKCNYCNCGPEGKDASCTRMACVED